LRWFDLEMNQSAAGGRTSHALKTTGADFAFTLERSQTTRLRASSGMNGEIRQG
jgi:hypothetical protein